MNLAMIADRLATLSNLPAESNVFIGRERDLTDLASILDRVRAVTMCGPGGIGKTRLALALAASLAGGYPDGVWIVEQAEADRPERLVPLVAAALGVIAEPHRPLDETLVEALAPRTMLLILDTCEHLIADCAELVQRLLGSCPGLRVIATSREPLRVQGEVIWRVPPLGLVTAGWMGDAPQAGIGVVAASEAVRLFVARAVAVRPDFELTAANATIVADLCRTLDGVPLAIELAAARLGTLTAEQIQMRLSSRFELLAHGDRTAPPRQQTLRATVAWSYDLLTGTERLLLSRLSVFCGWNLEMAEQVCADEVISSADVLDLLTALIDKSLVTVEYELDQAVRYRLLDTVRQFATDQISTTAELARMRQAHRDCMLALAEKMVRSALLPDSPSWQERVDAYHRAMADWTNCLQALEYCADHDDVEEGLRLCNAMRIAWLAVGDQSASVWLDKFLSRAGAVTPALRSRALVVRSEIAFEQQDYVAAQQYAQVALSPALSTQDGNPAGAKRMLALLALAGGRPAEALDEADASLAAARQVADRWEEGITLAVKGAAIASQGDLDGAHAAYTDALGVLGDSRGWAVANVRYGLGRLARVRGDDAEARRHFSDALGLYRQVGARPQMARCLASLGQLALDANDLPTARASLTEAMTLSLLTGQRLAIARGVASLAALALAGGDFAGAVRLAGTAKTLFAALPDPQPAAAGKLENLVEAARGDLGREAVLALLAEGRGMSAHEAARRARTTAGPPRRREPTGWPGPLTEREREIAVLVAQGLSNRVIGDRLFITQATVARHIANIFGKLDFSSRAQLIAWVVKSTQDGLCSPPSYIL
jgi:predicted ATPase/DNA-binding CsgD family transcriptional regulator